MAANTERTMLPLHYLLNPSANGSGRNRSQHAAPEAASSSSNLHASPVFPAQADGTLGRKAKKADHGSLLVKSKARGPVNFPPHEDLDAVSRQAVDQFQVTTLGTIHRSFQHIPYSSSKKDLFDKTGRESIEAFKYEFRVPGHDRVFVVMWDYNIGIVRMNPFIKWGGFPKTKSSQMLDKNPGLRDISPGPTGGSVLAQGYWVPYKCARALCASFCYPIAGALIPLFGPSFPSECTPPDSSAYNEMIVSRPLLAEATREAEISRRYYMSKALATRNGMAAPSHEYQPLWTNAPDLSHPSYCHHPSSMPYDTTGSLRNNIAYRRSPLSAFSSQEAAMQYLPAGANAGSWFTPENAQGANLDPFDHSDPYLSAIPRRTPSTTRLTEGLGDTWASKRRRLHHHGVGFETVEQSQGGHQPDHEASTRGTIQQPKSRPLEHYDAAVVLAMMRKDNEDQPLSEVAPKGDSRAASFEPSHSTKRQRAKSL